MAIKKHKSITLGRISNAIKTKVSGCMSANCPFRTDDPDGIGTANICTCKTDVRELMNQLDRELKSIGA